MTPETQFMARAQKVSLQHSNPVEGVDDQRSLREAPGVDDVVPAKTAERKRRMSEIIARVAEEDRELLIKLAR